MTEVPSYSTPFELDMLLLEPVHAMMEVGILVDPDELAKHQHETIKEWFEAQEALDYLVGGSLNVASSKQLCEWFYDKLGFKARTRTVKGKKKRRADEEAIRSIMSECDSKLKHLVQDKAKERYSIGKLTCHYVLKIKGLRKLLSSYLGMKISAGELAGFSKLLDPDGRMRGTVSVGGTETARFSHSKTLWGTGVNQATVPRKVRTMYIADEGYEFAELDLNRGESWIYAHLSEDPELLRIHLNGGDFHSETAAAISSVFVEEPRSVEWIIEHSKNRDSPFHDEAYKLRYIGKRDNHATSYRMGPFKGAETVNEEAEETGITVTMSEFRKAQEIWHMKYFMIKSKWWPEIEQQLEDNRTLVTPYGRVHQFHERMGKELFKSATAYVPQSTSVDYLNRGMLKVYHKLQKSGVQANLWDLKILTQTHDSILIMYKEQYRADVIPTVASLLTSKLTIKGKEFSIPVEASVGNSWGTLKDYEFDLAAA